MKSNKLKSCVSLLSKADVTIISEQHFSFNKFIKLSGFQKELERLVENAFDEHMNNHAKFKGDISHYLFCIQSRFNELHKKFYDNDDLLLHRRLRIFDFEGENIEFNELRSEIQEAISNFIMLQRSALHCLSQRFNYLNKQIINSHIKWLGSKNDLYELSLALFNGGFVGFEDKQISKTEFFDHMSRITGINLDAHNVSQYKILNRDNPTNFLDSLKEVIIKLINNKSK